jgi:hypothetical protein
LGSICEGEKVLCAKIAALALALLIDELGGFRGLEIVSLLDLLADCETLFICDLLANKAAVLAAIASVDNQSLKNES